MMKKTKDFKDIRFLSGSIWMSDVERMMAYWALFHEKPSEFNPDNIVRKRLLKKISKEK